jgi:LysM repeat protein
VSAHQQYQVRPGDTLSSISRKFGVKVSDLVAANGIRGSVIKVGQQLRVPLKSGSNAAVQSSTRPNTNTSKCSALSCSA